MARGPQIELPDDLFAAARAEDRLAELDAACQLAAVGAEREDIKTPLTLFVNVEPDVAPI